MPTAVVDSDAKKIRVRLTKVADRRSAGIASVCPTTYNSVDIS